MLELIGELLNTFFEYLFRGKRGKRVLHWIIVLVVFATVGLFTYLFVTRGL